MSSSPRFSQPCLSAEHHHLLRHTPSLRAYEQWAEPHGEKGQDRGSRSPSILGPPPVPDPHPAPLEPKLDVWPRCALVLNKETHEPGPWESTLIHTSQSLHRLGRPLDSISKDLRKWSSQSPFVRLSSALCDEPTKRFRNRRQITYLLIARRHPAHPQALQKMPASNHFGTNVRCRRG